MKSRHEAKIEAGKKVTQKDINHDLQNGFFQVLYFATEQQVLSAIKAGAADEDCFAMYQNYQEELRSICADAIKEFNPNK